MRGVAMRAAKKTIAIAIVIMIGSMAIPAGATGGVGLWLRRYNGPANGYDTANAIAVSPDGKTVFVTGSSVGNGSNEDVVTYAYRASSGAILWGRRYNGTGNNLDSGEAIAVSND